MSHTPLRISFKDPDGFVFTADKKYYRVVFRSYAEDLELIDGTDLLTDPALVLHTPIPEDRYPAKILNWIREVCPDQEILAIFGIQELKCITYPWEWTPSMLRDAALHTLELQERLISSGLTLKDASFFNIQFLNGKPIFIDLLSIKKTDRVYPWFAYGQFLGHFVYPLLLIKYKKFELPSLLWSFQDGINVRTIKRLLPKRSFFNSFELINVHLLGSLAGSSTVVEKETLRQKEMADEKSGSLKTQQSRLRQLLAFSKNYLGKLRLGKTDTHRFDWEDYYTEGMDDPYQRSKEEKVVKMIGGLDHYTRCLDLGANTGKYSAILLKYFNEVISVEQDLNCCEQIRSLILASGSTDREWTVINADLLSPSPAIGWMNKERKALLDRLVSPLVVSLALIHHLYFKGSIDFGQIAALFARLAEQHVLIEFVGREDEKVKILSGQNMTRYALYSETIFEKEMSRYFKMVRQEAINETRTLYLFSKIA